MLKKTQVLTGISILSLIFLIVHFSMINVFAMPQQWKSPELHMKAATYSLPLFRQTWGVFAPVPREEGRLFYRYYANGKWSQEFSFKDEMKRKNHNNAPRIADMVCYYLGSSTRAYTKHEEGQADYTEVKTSMNYAISLYSVYAYVKYQQLKTEPDSVQLILERDLFPKKGFSQKKTIRDYFKPDANWKE